LRKTGDLSDSQLEAIKLQYDVSKIIALTCFASVASLVLFLGENFRFYNRCAGHAILLLLCSGILGLTTAICTVVELRLERKAHGYTTLFLVLSLIFIFMAIGFGIEGFREAIDKIALTASK
jgi:cytochrome bd-type quinol oxidase subunit 2